MPITIAVANDIITINKQALADAFPYLGIELIRATLTLQIASKSRKRKESFYGGPLCMENTGIVLAHQAVAGVVTDILPLSL